MQENLWHHFRIQLFQILESFKKKKYFLFLFYKSILFIRVIKNKCYLGCYYVYLSYQIKVRCIVNTYLLVLNRRSEKPTKSSFKYKYWISFFFLGFFSEHILHTVHESLNPCIITFIIKICFS